MEAAVEYIIIYILVAVDTSGGTPNDIITGLKIDPPPRPRAPPIKPPNKAKNSKYVSYLPLYLMSEGTSPRPTFYFKAYSVLLTEIPQSESDNRKTIKIVKIIQSKLLHFLIESKEFFLPLMKLTNRLNVTAMSANKCFEPYLKWEASFLKRLSRDFISSSVTLLD